MGVAQRSRSPVAWGIWGKPVFWLAKVINLAGRKSGLGAGVLRRDGTSTQAERRPGRRGMETDGFGHDKFATTLSIWCYFGMIREYSDGDPAPLQRQVPKYVKLEMFEGKYGFLLEPVCIITGHKVEVQRVRISEKRRTLLENVYGGKETWQVQVWEYAEGYDSATPTWLMTFGPDTTREEAEAEAKKVREMYGNWHRGDMVEEFQQFVRPADGRISIPPKKPKLKVGETPSAAETKLIAAYEIHKEERAARFKVLGTVLPKTVELTQKAEDETDVNARRQLEAESLEAYFAENAPGWSPIIFKAWQCLNPIGLKWMRWLYVWHSKQIKSRKEINAVDYELAFNWRWKAYHTLTAEQLKDEVLKETKQLLSAEAIKKRRERLGLTTKRPTGPPPKSNGQ